MNAMKASRLSGALFAAALLCSIPTFANNTMKKSLEIHETISVEGVQLAPGSYRFEWNEPGPNVDVKIMHNGETVATVPAHIVQESTSNDVDGYTIKAGPNGDKYQSLTEIFFRGEKYDLQIDQGSPSSKANANDSSGMAK
jgi:hypothetical protein